MRQLLDRPSPAPRRGSRVLLLAVLCGALALAQGVAQILPAAAPAPRLTTSCDGTQCLPGQLCCPACGQPDCGNRCFVAVKGRCPLFV
ncbi:MAG TPA: hypothetical protein VFC23_10705 [Thermoanaerobaculia bacterium]|nr:hypothetical protein [Thermoanaerobaculia bacterium]